MEIAASSILSGLQMQQNAVQQNRAQQFNERLWEKQFDLQSSRQDALNINSYATKMAAARRAGLNPLVALGGTSTYSDNITTPNVDASLHPSESPNFAQNFLQSLQIKQQAQLNGAQINNLEAQTKYQEAQTRKQNIENAREEAADEWFRTHPVWSFVSITNPDGSSESFEKIVESFTNKGAFDAAQIRNTYEVNNAENYARREAAKLAETVAYFKRINPEVLDAIATMPLAEKQHLQVSISNIFKDIEKKTVDIDNVKAETLYKQLRTQIERDTNLQMLIRDLKVDPSVAADIFILLTAGDGMRSGSGIDIAGKVLDFLKLKKGNLPTDKDFKSTKSTDKSTDKGSKSTKSSSNWKPTDLSEANDWTDYVNGN